VGQARGIVGVLEEDRRLGVGVGDAATVSPLRRGKDLLSTRLFRHDTVSLADHPRGIPVLA